MEEEEDQDGRSSYVVFLVFYLHYPLFPDTILHLGLFYGLEGKRFYG